jgi:alginate O-acetyltransferase complex protein AlgI
MVFNSLHFAIFFVVVLTVVSVLRNRVTARNAFLLACGYYFYGWWDWRFLGLLAFTTCFDYFCGRMLGDGTKRGFDLATADRVEPTSLDRGKEDVLFRGPGDRAFLAASIVVNLVVLGFFKYFNFFVDSAEVLLRQMGFHPHVTTLNVILPVGISFYTFQSMSYIIDVYRGVLKSERNFLTYATFVAFFPPLVAGPIERASHLLPQLKRPSDMTLDRFYAGSYLIGWGLFKKVVIADNVAVVADACFELFKGTDGNPVSTAGLTAWIGMYAFAIQIYCDFSGYTDIARGVARCMGFELTLNFNLPYFSVNPSDFWKRWHISLSSWLRDYLYIPLGGNRKGNVRTYVNLMLTMLIGGLWHGAAWTYVIWGAYQGALLCVHRLFKPGLDRLPLRGFAWTLARVVVMFHLICIGWLVFRAETVAQAWRMLRAAFTSVRVDPLDPALYLTLAVTGGVLLIVQLAQAWTREALVGFKLPAPLRAVAYAAVLLGIIIFGEAHGRAFIYFQF